MSVYSTSNIPIPAFRFWGATLWGSRTVLPMTPLEAHTSQEGQSSVLRAPGVAVTRGHNSSLVTIQEFRLLVQ